MIAKSTVAAGLISLAALAAPAEAASLTVTPAGVHVQVGAVGPVHDYGYRPGYPYGYGRYDLLTPQEVRQVLRHRGYRDINYVDRDGAVYQVRATDYRGRRVGLVVSARSGAIITAYRI
jgi:hypothetical protein